MITPLSRASFTTSAARAVQAGTWNFINPKITLDIVEELEKYMGEHHLGNLTELKGTLVEEVPKMPKVS